MSIPPKKTKQNFGWIKTKSVSILQSADKQSNPLLHFHASGSKHRYPCTQTASAGVVSLTKSRGRVLEAGVLCFFSLFKFYVSKCLLSECWTTFGLKVGKDNLRAWRRKKVWAIFCGFFKMLFYFCRYFLLWHVQLVTARAAVNYNQDGGWTTFPVAARFALWGRFKVRPVRTMPSSRKSDLAETILGAQEIRGLWRVYPLARTSRNVLLIDGITFRQQTVQVHDKNPITKRGGSGEEMPAQSMDLRHSNMMWRKGHRDGTCFSVFLRYNFKWSSMQSLRFWAKSKVPAGSV